jgi:predicted Zn-dependent protease
MNYLKYIPIGSLLLLNFLVSGCAVNPVSGQSELVFMSEDQEIAIGRKTHAEIIKSYGEYPDKALQEYVQRVGEQLARRSHRSNLIYRFTVLDSAEVNAFALPGGYIYITRGLMAYLDNEAQLAAVLGHEIAHVTARHAVRQHAAATTTGILGAVVATAAGVPGSGDLANVAGTALVRGYGRQHELEADRLGAEYLARASYSPDAMLNVIRILKDQEQFDQQLAKQENREPRAYHGLFSTHPENDVRLKEAINEANRFRVSNPKINRSAYLNQINGMIFGDGERDGIRRGRHFYHKKLDFSMSFPSGWSVNNLSDRIIANSPRGDGILQLTVEDINRKLSPKDFITTRLKQKNLRNGESIVTPDGMPGYTAITRTRTSYGERMVRLVVIYHDNRAFILAGASKQTNDPYRYDALYLDAARSFHRLRANERQLATPLQIQLMTAQSNTNIKMLAATSRIPSHPESQLRLLNHMFPKGEPHKGMLLKIVE